MSVRGVPLELEIIAFATTELLGEVTLHLDHHGELGPPGAGRAHPLATRQRASGTLPPTRHPKPQGSAAMLRRETPPPGQRRRQPPHAGHAASHGEPAVRPATRPWQEGPEPPEETSWCEMGRSGWTEGGNVKVRSPPISPLRLSTGGRRWTTSRWARARSRTDRSSPIC